MWLLVPQKPTVQEWPGDSISGMQTQNISATTAEKGLKELLFQILMKFSMGWT